jgi:hypothetical protein
MFREGKAKAEVRQVLQNKRAFNKAYHGAKFKLSKHLKDVTDAFCLSYSDAPAYTSR